MQAKTIRLFSSAWSASGVPVLKSGLVEDVDVRDQELVLVADRLDLVIGVEDLRFVEAQALDDVLVGVCVDRFLECLAQQVLPALGRGDVAIGAEHDVVGGKAVGGDEEAEIALDDQALVVGEAVRVLPQLDVALHVHFLRHPVVGAGRDVLVPGPAVLERHQLVDVGLAVDDALVLHADAAEAVGHRLLLDVEIVHRFPRELGRQDPAGGLLAQHVRRHPRLRGRGEVVVEIQHGSCLLYCIWIIWGRGGSVSSRISPLPRPLFM